MFSLYDLCMIPLEKRGIKKARLELIKKAKGMVLEIGSGTGVNVKHYDFEKIDSLILSDKKLSKKIKSIVPNTVTLDVLNVTSLPYPDNSIDTVVHTLVFCSVDNVTKGLSEIKRVLKPSGRLLFIEHIHPEGKKLGKLFRFINPVWRKVAGGCNLIRDYEKSLVSCGFEVVESNKFMNTVFVYGEAIKMV